MDSGTILAGRYRLVQLIGRGGMGEVWRARDLELLRDVAIKILLDANSAQHYLTRFQREAQVMARLQHPGITVVHDVGRQENHLFIVMELLTGRNLGAILAEHPHGLPAGRALALAIQAADALAVAHAGGVVHRDLKPTNLFVQPGDWLKICDFGIARDIEAASLTLGSDIFGTPAYMSPEQWNGTATDARSDLYSLGCVLYAMLTGRPPFPVGQPLPALMYQHLTAPPAPLRHSNQSIPGSLDALVLSLLAKNRDDRPASAALVAATLRRIQAPTITIQPGVAANAGDRVHTVPMGPVPPGAPGVAPAGTPPADRRARAWPWYAAGLLAAVAVGTYYLVGQAGHALGPPPSSPTPSRGSGAPPAPGAVSAAAVAKVGSSAAIAVQGPNHSLYVYWQGTGTGPWTRQTVAPAGSTYSPPSIAQVGSIAVIAAQGPNNSLDFYWQAVGSLGWNQEMVAPAGTTFSPPAVTQVSLSSVIVAQGANHSLDYYWQVIGTTGWNPEIVAPAGTTYSSPVIAQADLSPIVAAEGPNHSLDFYWQTIGISTWNPEMVAAAGTTYSPPALAHVGNISAVAAQGPNHSLDFYWQTVGTTPWNPETVAGRDTTYSPPAIAPVGDSAAIAAQGPGHSLDYYWQTVGTAPWHPQTVAGAGTTYTAPAVAQVGNLSDITAYGPSGSLFFYQAAAGATTWSREQAAAPASAG
jgi:hypothetical protein